MEDRKACEGVSSTFTRRSAVVANSKSLTFPSTRTFSTVALRMFELDGKALTTVASAGAAAKSVKVIVFMHDRHTRFRPASRGVVCAQLLELGGHIKGLLLLEELLEGQIALRHYAGIRRQTGFSDEGIVGLRRSLSGFSGEGLCELYGLRCNYSTSESERQSQPKNPWPA